MGVISACADCLMLYRPGRARSATVSILRITRQGKNSLFKTPCAGQVGLEKPSNPWSGLLVLW